MILAFIVIGGPGMVDDVRSWAEILGMNILITIALIGLASHLTAVGFNDGEPYRSWWRKHGIGSRARREQEKIERIAWETAEAIRMHEKLESIRDSLKKK